jgi:hypothetical protein
MASVSQAKLGLLLALAKAPLRCDPGDAGLAQSLVELGLAQVSPLSDGREMTVEISKAGRAYVARSRSPRFRGIPATPDD